MGDANESGELLAEGGEADTVIQDTTRETGTSQESNRELDTSHEGTRELDTGHEGTKELNTGHEGTRELDTGHEATREPNTSQEGTREPNTSQEGTREPNTSQEGTREPNTSQEGARDPNTSQEGDREPSSEGTRESITSQEGPRDPNNIHEGARDLNPNQEGTGEPTSQEGIRDLEESIGQDSARGLSAEHIENVEPSTVVVEDGEELVVSSYDPSEPHYDEYVIPKEDEQEMTEVIGQEPSLVPKEEPEPSEEEQEEDQEAVEDQNQDPELQEEIDEQIREELLHQYHVLVQERDKIQQQNSQLQNKLYEYFRKKKGEESRLETTKHVADQEQRYLKNLSSVEEMRRKYKEDAALHMQQIEELRAQCQDIVSKVDKEWVDFQEQKKKIALYSISKPGAGRNTASSLTQEIELLQSREERKEKEVIQVRLENIKLKNQINRYESTLRSKEELAEGLHLIDFEQLKIENQTYNEKIEERNEELLKLRKKITNTVQVLTHVKEKLQYVQAENQEQKERLMEIEAVVGNKRDILTKTKQARDSLRMDNLKLKQKCGLLGNKVLLRDFEDKVDATEELRQTLENLKRRHAELTLSSKGLMKKIDEVKLVMES
ncbi:cilia- and flagella-associated protein 184 [Dendropsophus ebraccatus]|uniref:cilia- and flagella-associated protein 184 n=1 Tax=Dendropsophus ebraccatus TaxID=150705 RepID=UPI003831A4E8